MSPLATPLATMIDWMNSNDVEYDHIKKRAYDREDWRHWRPGPVQFSSVQILILINLI